MKAAAPHNHFESLLRAIVDADVSAARRLVKSHPYLAAARFAGARLYQLEIVHWIYAKDTALHLAAAGHRAAIVRILLAAGADPDAAGNHRRGRPLHYAADRQCKIPPLQQVQTLRHLLKAGADIDAADKNGATALHRAVRTRAAGAVEFLLSAGANPLARNHSGATPFHLAVQNTGKSGSGDPGAKAAQKTIIRCFLVHGCNSAMRDGGGKSVLDQARSSWIRQLLGAAE